MVNIKKIVSIIVLSIMVAAFLAGTGYGLWGHNTDVKFKLTISQPEEDSCCICGTYTSIQEGIDLLKNVQYTKICNRMDRFKDRLRARIAELNNLPIGGITKDELSQEIDRYRNVDIKQITECISTYGSCCINELANFYNKSSEKEKMQVPDFWDQHDELWDLSDQLWDRCDELYDIVDEVEKVGKKKIKHGHE